MNVSWWQFCLKTKFVKWKEVWIGLPWRFALSSDCHNNVAITAPLFYSKNSWHALGVQGENLCSYHWISFKQCVTNKTPAMIWIVLCRLCTQPTTVVLFVPFVIGQATHLPLSLLVVLCDLYPNASLGTTLVPSGEQGLVRYFLASCLPKIYLSQGMM